MKKVIMFIVILMVSNNIFTFAQGGWSSLKGSGKTIMLKPEVIDFDKIETQINAKIIVEIGKPKSLSIEIDDNLSNLLTIEQDDAAHKLTFKLDKTKLGKNTWVQNANIVVKISMPEMSVFTQRSNGKADISGLNGRYFRAENYGNGDILLRGAKVDVFDLESRGNGDVNAADLEATKAKISLQGNGQVRFNAAKTYEAELNGNGDIQNIGEGQATKINRVGNGQITDEKQKSVKRYQGAVDNPTEQIRIRFQNNSALPRKIAFIFYEPSKNGSNATAIKVLAPLMSATFTVEVGTRFYNANSQQVDTVMSGAKLTDTPFYIVQSGDKDKLVKLF